MTASLLKSPELFSVIWPFSIILSFGLPPLVRQLPSPPVPLLILKLLTKSTNYNWYNCHLHVPQFCQFPSHFEVLILLITFFQFYSVISRDSKVDNLAISLFFFFFLLIFIRSDLLAEIRRSMYKSKSHGSLWVLFSRTSSELSIYDLLEWSKLNFLHISRWIPLPTQSCLVLYSFCANLPHSLMWLMVSSLSPHSLHLLFCCILSYLALIWLVFMVLFCAAIRRDSVSLLKFSFLSHYRFCHVRILLLLLLSYLPTPLLGQDMTQGQF